MHVTSTATAPQDLWTAALDLLEPRYNKPVFEMWLKPMRLVDLTPSEIVLAVQTTFARDWVENRLKLDITSVLHELLGAEIALRVVVDPGNETQTPATAVTAAAKPAAPDDLRIGHLNSRYTFDDFVIGNSNRFAHAASQAVAEAPAMAYNPLFLYGGVGLGKTHLMHAIGHRVLERNPKANIVYVSSEKFTNEFIIAIKNNQTVEFRNRYRHVDVLLIDDIQFLEGKEQTQEEFFHTFNSLHEAQKQLVISSDRPPKEIQTLENRLRSRFEWGLLTDIQPPDFETREAILRKKAETEKVPVPDEVLAFIAKVIPSNIRELEGSLIRVVAFASLTKSPITVELAADVLKNAVAQAPMHRVTIPRDQGARRQGVRHLDQGDGSATARPTRHAAAPNRDVHRLAAHRRIAAADRAGIRQERPHDRNVRARQDRRHDGSRRSVSQQDSLARGPNPVRMNPADVMARRPGRRSRASSFSCPLPAREALLGLSTVSVRARRTGSPRRRGKTGCAPESGTAWTERGFRPQP